MSADLDEMSRALADIRREVASLPLRPEPGFETGLTAGVGVVGAIIGVADGLGVWAIPYAVVILIVWLALRCVIVLLARG